MRKTSKEGNAAAPGKAAKSRNRSMSCIRDDTGYRLSRAEWVCCLGGYAILDGAVSWLFYRSWIAFAVFLPAGILFIKECRRVLEERRRDRLGREFLTGMQAVSTALSAGYSMENAMEEALQELRRVMDEDAMILREFSWIVGGLHMNRTLEQLFTELADRSKVQDIDSFAQVFAAARKSGGDLIAIIRNTVKSIYEKEEIRQEILVCLAAKKMEQNVMSLVPFFILVYVQAASPGFLDVLYHNTTGIAVMTGCLGIYLSSWFLGRKIVEIGV